MKITSSEKHWIESLESAITSLKKVLEEGATFSVGDVLVAHQRSYDWGWQAMANTAMANTAPETPKYDIPILNSNSLPKKYKVIYVDKHNIPYIKELNRSGQPIGRIYSTIEFHGDREEIATLNYNMRFSLDPEFVDATLMDHEYDPTEKNRHYSKVRKEVAAFNKAAKIPLNNEEDINNFFTNVKVGDVFWRSNAKSITVTEISVHKTSKLQKAVSDDDSYIEVRTNKGKTEKYRTWNLFYMNLYKDQPKSFQKSV